MKNNLSLYFGIKGIEGVWAKGRKIISNFSIPQKEYSSTGIELEEKVPGEIKIVALIKERLRKYNIETQEVSFLLSAKDLIIRSFELPLVLPKNELSQAVNFEAKKYIPFKMEELILDFQTKIDKKAKKTAVVLMGIKKETLNFYLSIIKELEFKLTNIEYAGFSLLRFAQMLNLDKKNGYIFLNLDLDDETSFILTDEGFPLFTRDVYIKQESEEKTWQEKLRNEIKLSLDYIRRRFPFKNIKKMFIFGPKETEEFLSYLTEEIDLDFEFIDLSKRITGSSDYTLSCLKTLGGALRETIRLPFNFDLLKVWEEEQKREKKEIKPIKISLKELKPAKPSSGVLILSIILPIFVFAWQFSQRIPIKKQQEMIVSEQIKNYPLLGSQSVEELQQRKSDYSVKINSIKEAYNRYPYLTTQLDLIPKIIPEGLWLVRLNFSQSQSKRELSLEGRAYLEDYNKELEAINKFYSDLKNHPYISKVYKNIELVSMERSEISGKEVSNFVINCRE